MQNTLVRKSRTHEAASKRDDRNRLNQSEDTGRQTLEIIFRRERAGLIRYLKGRVGPELACDIAQEVFLRAATSPQLSSLDNARSFLFCIARNLLIDAARREQCRVITLPLNEVREPRCDAEQEQAIEASDLKSCLDRALTQLPERTRTIFVMNRFDEMAYRDIRHELDISMAAVEYHMMKALSHIRIALGQAV